MPSARKLWYKNPSNNDPRLCLIMLLIKMTYFIEQYSSLYFVASFYYLLIKILLTEKRVTGKDAVTFLCKIVCANGFLRKRISECKCWIYRSITWCCWFFLRFTAQINLSDILIIHHIQQKWVVILSIYSLGIQACRPKLIKSVSSKQSDDCTMK